MKPRNNGVEHKSLEERAAEFGGQLNLDGEFDRPPTVGRERWDEYDNEAPTQMNKQSYLKNSCLASTLG